MNFQLNIVPSPPDDRDFIAESIFPPVRNLNIPRTLDLRKNLRPIRNQGNQGTCAAQTGACMKEWHEMKDINLQQYMSPQFIYNNRSNYPEGGMHGRDLMKILQKQGCCREEIYKYGVIESPAEINEIAVKEALNFTVKGYAQVNTILGVKEALYINGPCYIAFPVYDYSSTFWKQKQGEKMIGGHAVAIVGYTADAFIIRNSWGKSWGFNGYTFYPFQDFGSHWEIWTVIDNQSEKVKSNRRCKLFHLCERS